MFINRHVGAYISDKGRPQTKTPNTGTIGSRKALEELGAQRGEVERPTV